MSVAPAALTVRGLRVELASTAAVVDDVSLHVAPGEALGLVGESGSGKTTTALALLGFARPGVRIVAGEVEVAGRAVPPDDERAARALRGSRVGYVPQDPGNSLNPALRIGASIQDVLDEHVRSAPRARDVPAALASVHLPGDSAFARRFPHQLSGGQQQRVTIAMALACEPPLVVLDEPTTGLDVVTQARVLDELRRLRAERGLSLVYVSHDLAVVSQIADRLAVLYAGRVIEEGPVVEVLSRPRHPYTRGLVASIPDHVVPRRLRSMPGVAVGVGERPPGCAFAPRCPQRRERCERELPELEPIGDGREVRCFEWRATPATVFEPPAVPTPSGAVGEALLRVESLAAEHRGRHETTVAAHEVSFEIPPGGCVALVGESGSGKTTIARCIAGLHTPSGGRILLDGVPLAARAARRPVDARRRIQIVFQNPYDSLNPRHRVADSIARPARVLRGLGRQQAAGAVAELLERVRLPTRVAARFPGELSGGERQRVAIARALAAGPDLLICDEITSALDVSVQAAVLELLAELRGELGVAVLFISHDLGVVASVADRVLVLERGAVCEQGRVADVLARPQHPYTQALLDAAPRLPEAAA
ncbi:MAG TPA: ABC transporter ATP-binding protein [Gaiellaceae bacterium]